MMSSHDAWRLGPPPVSRHVYSHHTMDSAALTYVQKNPLWLWANSNQSVWLPIAILVASVLFSSNILDILFISAVTLLPKKVQQTLWDLLVAALPASLLFWLEDTMAPTKGGRAPRNYSSATVMHMAKSNSLSTILKLGARSRRAAATKEWIETIFRRVTRNAIANSDPNGLRGLENPQNKCYRNTVLQGLSSMDSMAQYLQRALERDFIMEASKSKSNKQTQTLATVRSLDHLVTLLREPAGTTPSLVSDPILEMIPGASQQDAQEYLLKLLDCIETELKDAAIIQTRASLVLTPPCTTTHEHETPVEVSMSRVDSKASDSSEATVTSSTSHANHANGGCKAPAPTPAPDFRLPLEALIAERKCCRVCNYSEGMNLDPTCCLTLGLPYIGSPNYKPVYDLEELISILCEGEVLEGVNCSNCTLLKMRDELLDERKFMKNSSGDDDTDTDDTELTKLETRLAEIQKALSTKTFDDDTLINKCNVKNSDYVRADKVKEVGFASAPPGLAMQINRSTYDARAMKDARKVYFPNYLDFSPWYLGSALPHPSHSINVANLQGADKKVVQELEHQPKKAVYKLRCAIMHAGAHNRGHYFCYRQNRFSKPGKGQPSSVLSSAVHTDRAARKERKERSPSVFDEDDSATVAGSEDDVSCKQDSAGEASGSESGDDADEDREPAQKKRKLVVAESVEEETACNEDESAPWWVLSDEATAVRPDEAVFGMPSDVYMLFYDRVYGEADYKAAEAELAKDAIEPVSGDSAEDAVEVVSGDSIKDQPVVDSTVQDATVEDAEHVEHVESVAHKASESDTETEAGSAIQWANDTTTEVETETDPSVDDTEDEHDDVTPTYAKQSVVVVPEYAPEAEPKDEPEYGTDAADVESNGEDDTDEDGEDEDEQERRSTKHTFDGPY